MTALSIFLCLSFLHAAEPTSNLSPPAPNSFLSFPTTGQDSVTLVDPELIHISSTSVERTEPPPQVHLPEVIANDRQWRGVQCAVTEPRQAVFRHADKWQAFWEKGLAPYSSRLQKIPKIDFDKEMVVGVFLGEKDYPYYEIEIRSIKPLVRPGEAPKLIVKYHEISKMSGVFTPPFPIQPFDLRKVPIFTGPIEFVPTKH